MRAFKYAALWIILGAVCTLNMGGLSPAPARAQAGSAYDVIAAVNALRTARGLPPYEVNGALMFAAQEHSDYQASIGSATHTGKGGTNARDRAAAAGYGGGARINVVENIAMGMNMSAAQAVAIWQGDSLHLNTMLSSSATDAGAGVAVSGDMVYYTLDVGYVVGQEGAGGNDSPPASPGVASGALQPGASTSKPTQWAARLVLKATPGPDGAIYHTVEQGQTLWSIAATYQIALAELLSLNGLSENAFIRPGDKLLVQAGSTTPTLTLLPSETKLAAEAAEVATLEPIGHTMTPIPTAAQVALVEKTLPVEAVQGPAWVEKNDPILIIILVCMLSGLLLVTIGFALRRGA